MTTATAPAITREVLEDRYEGLINEMNADGEDIEPTDLQLDLWRVLKDLVMGTARSRHDETTWPIAEDLCVTIRRTIVERVLAEGLADPEPWSQYKAAAS